MEDRIVVLLGKQTGLYKAVADWRLPNVNLFINDSPSEALAFLADGRGDLLIFDTAGYRRTAHVMDKFMSLKGDADLVVIGDPAVLSGLGARSNRGAVRRVDHGTPPAELRTIVERLLNQRIVRAQSGIVGRSRAVNQMLAMIAQAAPLDVNILIQGESGTGKELVARAIHRHSTRSDGQFLSINCGALSEGVLESELFGHAKGAFTGAVSRHEGVFQRANKGTLFMDEVAELPLSMQTRFLRALETGEFTPVGGAATLTSDIRLVAATHRDLAREVEAGTFRQDLFYRLRVVVITIPPLRERKEDIPVLVETFLAQENARLGMSVRGLSRPALRVLDDYHWPGNIRELRNLVSSLVVMKQSGMIESEDLPAEIKGGISGVPNPYVPMHVGGGSAEKIGMDVLAASLLELRHDVKEIKAMLRDGVFGSIDLAIPSSGAVIDAAAHDIMETDALQETEGQGDLRTAERRLIESALAATGGNRRLAAERLGISERTLYRKIKAFGL